MNHDDGMTQEGCPTWESSMVDQDVFSHEQRRLGTVWTVLGLTTELPKDGDWFRFTLGGRSIFVQRFGESIKGYENVCPHRFYPLRNENKGNGVIRCGFHHWQFNKEGEAVGIPHCQQLFGKTPKELGVRLQSVEIATCGSLIFGRFPSPEETETLEQYLGEAWAILRSMCGLNSAPHFLQTKVVANWKPLYHVTMDDYHIVAVHPSTFGKHGYLDEKNVRYYRFGRHSAFFDGASDNALKEMEEECRSDRYRCKEYRIMQIFPNLLVAQIKAVTSWYILVQQYVPEAHDQTTVRVWYFLAPFPIEDKSWLHQAFRRYIEFWQPPFVRHYIRKITGEDHAVCEQIQSIAKQIKGGPILGLEEQRIAWFEEAYAQTISGKNFQR
jgi:phenylpropionate dioxygenase-like ring-hydroxylating dioxygenase large terminal subunit